MENNIRIANRVISKSSKAYIVAEMSANHNLNYDRAVEIIRVAKDIGADAVKLQTYTPDTITLNSNEQCFKINQGTIWDGMTLYDLYKKAYTPWEWQPRLQSIAKDIGIDFFSSPFDETSVDFLEKLNIPMYKVASFEITDIPLIQKIARTNKPILISTGVATLSDIELAISTIQKEGNNKIILLKCCSAYPTPYEDINLRTMVNIEQTFGCLVGLSDHTLGSAVATASVALGAKVIEKHLTLSRKDGGVDSSFSMEPNEFKNMVQDIRIVEKAMGRITYELSEKQSLERQHSRSLFIVKDMKAGEILDLSNLRSIRPAKGLHTKYLNNVLGLQIKKDVRKGTPLSWDLIDFK